MTLALWIRPHMITHKSRRTRAWWKQHGEAIARLSVSGFANEQEAFDFCQKVYAETGGVTPALRQAYEFYLQNYNSDRALSHGDALASRGDEQPWWNTGAFE